MLLNEPLEPSKLTMMALTVHVASYRYTLRRQIICVNFVQNVTHMSFGYWDCDLLNWIISAKAEGSSFGRICTLEK